MWRQRLYARFPLFAAYIAYVAVQMVLRSAFLANQHFYFYVYWLTAPIEVILSLLAAHESFLKVFRSFYLLWWFRIFFPGAIVVAVAYSAWKGYASPPVHVSASGAAIISAAPHRAVRDPGHFNPLLCAGEVFARALEDS
jgi:hypothetical protein